MRCINSASAFRPPECGGDTILSTWAALFLFWRSRCRYVRGGAEGPQHSKAAPSLTGATLFVVCLTEVQRKFFEAQILILTHGFLSIVTRLVRFWYLFVILLPHSDKSTSCSKEPPAMSSIHMKNLKKGRADQIFSIHM